MKDLKLSASRIDNQIMCFFYIELTSNLDGNPEGKICVVNSNAGASLNQIAIDRNDIYLHKKGGNGVPDLISIPLSYIDKCEFSTF